MTYCSKCGYKNEDTASYCTKCGISLDQSQQPSKDDDCVCEGDNRNPLSPIFWGLAIILVGLWVVYNYGIPHSMLPSWLQHLSFCNLIFLILAIAIILTGIRKMTK